MAGRADTSRPNRHHLVTGTSGSGKTSWVRQYIAASKAKRVIAWDPDEDYALPRVRSLSALARTLAAAKSGPVQIALTLHATPEAFEGFCRIVWAYLCASRPCLIVVEELADVTTPAKAGPNWGMVVRRARKYGGDVIAVTQRPAECDKTIYSQAAYKWVGILDNDADRKRLVPLLSVPAEALASLSSLEYFYKEPGPQPAKRGRVVIPKVKGGASVKRRA